MSGIEVEVMSQHYIGPLFIEPINGDLSFFAVYLKGELLGRVQPILNQGNTYWYSVEITDKELLDQIGEWIEHHYF